MSARGFIKGAFCVVAFGAGLAVAAAALQRALPFPQVDDVETKVLHYRARAADYDTLFIGTSRFYHQIVPAQFDAAMGTRSFNAGIDGMRPPELTYYAGLLLDAAPSRLRYVFLEAVPIRTTLDEDKRDTIRSVYWHDWTRTWQVAQRMTWYAKPQSLTYKLRKLDLDTFTAHLRLLGENQTNLGRGCDWVKTLASPGPRKIPTKALGPHGDGFLPDERGEKISAEALAQFEKEMAERRAAPAPQKPMDDVSNRVWADLCAQIRALGAEPVFLIPPTTNKQNYVPELQPPARVLDFSSLDVFPELFAVPHRLDTDHLNTAGARVFTARLVEKLKPQ